MTQTPPCTISRNIDNKIKDVTITNKIIDKAGNIKKTVVGNAISLDKYDVIASVVSIRLPNKDKELRSGDYFRIKVGEEKDVVTGSRLPLFYSDNEFIYVNVNNERKLLAKIAYHSGTIDEESGYVYMFTDVVNELEDVNFDLELRWKPEFTRYESRPNTQYLNSIQIGNFVSELYNVTLNYKANEKLDANEPLSGYPITKYIPAMPFNGISSAAVIAFSPNQVLPNGFKIKFNSENNSAKSFQVRAAKINLGERFNDDFTYSEHAEMLSFSNSGWRNEAEIISEAGNYLLEIAFDRELDKPLKFTATIETEVDGKHYLYEVPFEWEKSIERFELEPAGYIPKSFVNCGFKNFKIKKIWENEQTTTDIQVQLYKNGDPFLNPITIKPENSTYEFKDLPLYKSSTTNSEVNEYTVKEVGETNNSITLNGKEYIVEYKVENDVATIMNKHIPPKTNQPPVPPSSVDPDKKEKTPPPPTLPPQKKEVTPPKKPEPKKHKKIVKTSDYTHVYTYIFILMLGLLSYKRIRK